MRRRFAGIVGPATLGILLILGATPARAATGKVLVFEHELTPMTVFHDPEGCYKLPPLAHVLANRTDGVVLVYADPLCLGPALLVPPGTGSHAVPLSGSFSV